MFSGKKIKSGQKKTSIRTTHKSLILTKKPSIVDRINKRDPIFTIQKKKERRLGQLKKHGF